MSLTSKACLVGWVTIDTQEVPHQPRVDRPTPVRGGLSVMTYLTMPDVEAFLAISRLLLNVSHSRL